MNEFAFFSLVLFRPLHIEQYFYFRLPSTPAVADCTHRAVVLARNKVLNHFTSCRSRCAIDIAGERLVDGTIILSQQSCGSREQRVGCSVVCNKIFIYT